MTFHAVPIPTTDRADWLEQRRQGIGASDVAGILGLSPWSTPWTVWADKTRGLEKQSTDAMYFGRVLEPVVLDLFEQESGLHVGLEDTLVRHPEREWMMCTVDALAFESPYTEPEFDVDDYEFQEPLGLVQAKTDGDFTEWDDVPDHYRLQVMWELMVTGLEHAWVPVFFTARRSFRIYEVDYDPTLADPMLTRVTEWYEKHIVGGEPPEVDAHPATGRVINDLWEAEEGRKIELSQQTVADLGSLVAARRVRDEAQAEVDRLERNVKVSLQEAEVGLVGGSVAVTWKESSSRRVDVKWLKAEAPDVYEKFSRESSSRRFLVKQGWEKF